MIWKSKYQRRRPTTHAPLSQTNCDVRPAHHARSAPLLLSVPPTISALYSIQALSDVTCTEKAIYCALLVTPRPRRAFICTELSSVDELVTLHVCFS